MSLRRIHHLAGAVILLLLVTILLGSSVASVDAQEASEPVVVTFEEIGVGEVPIFGKFDRDILWIPLPSNWVFDNEIVVDLDYVASSELHPDAAVGTQVNETHIASFRPINDGAVHRYTFSIPTTLLHEQEAGFFLTLEGYLPLSRDECEAPFRDGQWVTVQKSSRMIFNPQVDRAAPTLADLPQAIVVQGSYTPPPPVIFVVADDYSSETLTAAANIAAGLGRGADRTHLPFIFRTSSSVTATDLRNANLIFVGVPDDELPLELQGTDEDASPRLAADETQIELLKSPWSAIRNVLLIHASGVDGLALAGEAFVTPSIMNKLQGKSMIIGPGIRDLPVDEIRPWQQETTTFAQLGYGNLEVTGAGTQYGDYIFRRPPGWLLGDDSQVTLHLSANPDRNPELDEPAPTMHVFANDVEIGSVDFGEVGDAGDVWVTFDLPALTLNETSVGEERPQVIDLVLQIEHSTVFYCSQLNSDRFWTLVYDDSYFTVSYRYDRQLPNLQLLPYPFVNDEDVPVAIILDADPTLEEIGMGLSVAATLGHYAYDDLKLVLTTAGDAQKDELADSHLIILGQFETHPLIDSFMSGESRRLGVLDEFSDPGIGFLHETVSPWNVQRTVLAIYGETPEGLKSAAESLYMQAPPVVRPSSVAIVQGETPPEVFFRSDMLDSVRERELQQIQLTDDLLTGSVVLLLIVLVAAILLIGTRNTER